MAMDLDVAVEYVSIERGEIDRRIFSDPEIFEQEMELIFGRAWLFLAHESMLPKSGDFFEAPMGKDNVLVNCVAPGFTMSAGVEAHPEVIEKLRDVSVAARTIQRDETPEDVVGAVVYLSGPGSDFVTGQTIVIDGGQTFH